MPTVGYASTGPRCYKSDTIEVLSVERQNCQYCALERDVLDTCVFDRTGNSGKDITENRRININYPGSGNNSQFTYDGNGRIGTIIETIGSTVSSTKLFVWTKDSNRPYQPAEVRNNSGATTSQYFLSVKL